MQRQDYQRNALCPTGASRVKGCFQRCVPRCNRGSGSRCGGSRDLLRRVEEKSDSRTGAVEEIRAGRQKVGFMLPAIARDVGIGAASVALDGVAETLQEDRPAKLGDHLVRELLSPRAHEGAAAVISGMQVMPTSA
jgi:hypothetical protein